MENVGKEIKHRAPFLIIIGPADEWSFGQLEEGFSDFFDIFLSSRDLKEGVKALKAKQKKEEVLLSRSCQHTFYKLVQENIIDRDFGSKDNFENWLFEFRRLQPELQKKFENLTEKGIVKVKKRLWVVMYKELQDMRRTYFWIDKFPENESRFAKNDMPEEYPF